MKPQEMTILTLRVAELKAENDRLREALNYAWDLIEEASYSDSVMGVKQDRFLSTYYDENGLRAALGETE
jgi:cell shape-determining protein MreC